MTGTSGRIACWTVGALLTAGCVPTPPAATTPRSTPRTAPAAATVPTPHPNWPDDPTLDDYLLLAALNNPAMKAAFHRWRAAVLQAPQAAAPPNPSLTYRWYIEQVETRVGAQRQAVELAQRLPWFGVLALRGRAADKAAAAARQAYEAVKRELFYNVIEAYGEYYFLRHSMDTTRQTLGLLDTLEASAAARFRAGAAPQADVIRAQVERGKLADRLEALGRLRRPLAARLNAALNRPLDTPIPWPRKLPDRGIDIDADAWTRKLHRNNPELKALDREIERRQVEVDLAGKAYYPDLTLGVHWIDTAGAVGPMKPADSGVDPIIARLTIDVPLWRGKLDAGRRQARRRLASARAARTEKANALQVRLTMTLYRLTDAERKLLLYRDTLAPKAREAFAAAESAYRAGQTGFVDLLDTVRVLLEFQLAVERARVDRVQRLAELERLAGPPVSSPGGGDHD